MSILKISSRSNIIGAITSSLCLTHCLATPILFATHLGHNQGHHSHPFWWGLIDILFLFVSYIAIFLSSRTTGKQWMRFALWGSWGLLTIIIFNEKLELFHIKEELIYIPSLALIVLHLIIVSSVNAMIITAV